MSNVTVNPAKALAAYFEKAPSYCEPYGNGHINFTFLVVADRRYILQRMNTKVFPRPVELMENIIGVTEHIKKKVREAGEDDSRASLTVVPTLSGMPYFAEEDGSYWRLYDFVENTVT